MGLIFFLGLIYNNGPDQISLKVFFNFHEKG